MIKIIKFNFINKKDLMMTLKVIYILRKNF